MKMASVSTSITTKALRRVIKMVEFVETRPESEQRKTLELPELKPDKDESETRAVPDDTVPLTVTAERARRTPWTCLHSVSAQKHHFLGVIPIGQRRLTQ